MPNKLLLPSGMFAENARRATDSGFSQIHTGRNAHLCFYSTGTENTVFDIWELSGAPWRRRRLVARICNQRKKTESQRPATAGKGETGLLQPCFVYLIGKGMCLNTATSQRKKKKKKKGTGESEQPSNRLRATSYSLSNLGSQKIRIQEEEEKRGTNILTIV